MGYERITEDAAFDAVRPSHEWRYTWAAQYVQPTDVVLDVACGTGYGEKLLGAKTYFGVDKIEGHIVADLETWQPEFEYDVFVSIETIEHIENFRNILDMAKKARKYAIISTPIIPTKHRNEFHVNDFTAEQVKSFLPNLVAFSAQDSGDGSIKDMYGIAAFRI